MSFTFISLYCRTGTFIPARAEREIVRQVCGYRLIMFGVRVVQMPSIVAERRTAVPAYCPFGAKRGSCGRCRLSPYNVRRQSRADAVDRCGASDGLYRRTARSAQSGDRAAGVRLSPYNVRRQSRADAVDRCGASDGLYRRTARSAQSGDRAAGVRLSRRTVILSPNHTRPYDP